MFSKISPLIASLALAVLVCLPAQAQEIAVSHAQGETKLSGQPAKVLVFDLATLDTLDRLGVAVAGVPGGPKPAYLAKYNADSYAKIGTLFEPDYEAVNAARPDLIIVGGRSAAKFAELAKIAPTIDLTGNAKDYLGSVENNVKTLGRIFGKQQKAEKAVAELDSAVSALKAKAASKGKGLIVLTTGGRISAYGPGSRFGILHDAFGIVPAATGLDTGTHGQPVSFEYILKTNPDWLYVIDRDAAIGREGSPAKSFLDNELVRQTTAWKKNQVVYLEPANWYLVGGGLTALHQSIEQVSKAFDAPGE